MYGYGCLMCNRLRGSRLRRFNLGLLLIPFGDVLGNLYHRNRTRALSGTVKGLTS